MPNSIIAEGKTTNEAIENGLKQLHTTKNNVDIKVLENDDKRSFFSILAPRVVKVELTVKEEKNNHIERNNEIDIHEKAVSIKKEEKKFTQEQLDIAEKNIKVFLEKFLEKISNDKQYKIEKNESGIEVTIEGEETTNLIGYRGETLYSLQNILSAIASKDLDTRMRVILDIAGYKDKREKNLEELALKMERQVIRTKRSVTLEPMKAYERKIIHSALQNSEKVTTYSVGEEPRRRLVITLK